MRTATRKVVEVKFGQPFEDTRGKMYPDGYEWAFSEKRYTRGVLAAVNMHRAPNEAEAKKLRRRLQAAIRKALA